MRPGPVACCALALASLLPLSAAAEPEVNLGAGRFRASAEIRPQARSDDGRFALSASARVVPAATSRDGRFVLKAVYIPQVGCDPFPEPIFANGFETP